MSKIKLKILENKEECIINGIKVKNKITYFKDKQKITVLLNKNQLEIFVNCSNYSNHLYFSNDNSFCEINIDHQNTNFIFKTNKLLISENKIEISYIIDEEKNFALEIL